MRKKILAILMTVVFVMSGMTILANDVQDLREQYYGALEDVYEHEGELAVTRAAIDQIYEELRILDERLIYATVDLHNINMALLATVEALEQTAWDMFMAEDELERQYEAILDRLRDMQEQGSMGLLSVLFQATSLRDFLLRIEWANNMARYDREMVARLEASEARFAQMQEAYARQFDSVEILQLRQQAYVNYLEHLEAERIEYFTALVEDEYRLEALLIFYRERAVEIEAIWREAYEEEQRRIEQERIDRQRRLDEQRRAAIANLDGEFGWPVPSSFSISSPFGPRIHPITRRHDNHTGIDIRAESGSDIVAAADGVVILSGWNGGYGITVIIDHGGGIHTLYAHNSQNLVSVGDVVVRGQRIALIGSTGVSTGPHLHFEVRVGGTAVDPRPFLGLS